MATPFDRAAAVGAAAIARVRGERLRVVPMQRSRWGAAVADSERSSLDTVGTVTVVGDRIKMNESGAGNDFRHQIIAPQIVVAIELSRLSGSVHRAGDQIVRLDRPDAPPLEIVAIEPPVLAATRWIVAAVPAVVEASP